MTKTLTIVGGGLAGCEAALRAAAYGLKVRLWEMKPARFSPAHVNPDLAELVCSNSLRSDAPENAVGLLKAELRHLGSEVLRAADLTRVPAGQALAVDRTAFSREITAKISANSAIEIIREPYQPPLEVQSPIVIAAGPLADTGIASALSELTGGENLHFYDAIAPVVTFESLDLTKMFFSDRYGSTGEGDYLNAPFTQEEFDVFYQALIEADRSEPRSFEDEKYFEGCLPVEVMAQRGRQTLTFGPMKPVGLTSPATGRRPFAALQLRREDLAGTHWNLVGFQTRLTRPSQAKVFRLIPGLKTAIFAKWGSIHRNTFITAPKVLDPFMRLKAAPNVFVAGQLSGVEGYVESAAQGLWAGENAARQVLGRPLVHPPAETACGALLGHLASERLPFAPSNVTFGLFPPVPPEVPKRNRGQWRVKQAAASMEDFIKTIDFAPSL
ncbi:MAG: methylenetetrahydrofolate--tRNA-(uracil(54)-C(5))-methyltransferase (FADH(2)-oxidizing) TrmFO [Deltaproteobacteria bacterium]|jgi:methylenetetrahydrofolate--tRNA-(uracil-5-)-methyltransferase|nr:methylenetetrahydrofolate--tRNA-(uracil(54)-C(5))-methyltransferase (FADH(2)-oxidizing) TrmFO [Deltaproteobacteria bacterium]